MAEFIDIAVNEDGNFKLAPDGDAALIRDRDVILQDVKNEIMTYLGGMPWHPDYGGKLQHFLKDEGSTVNRKATLRELVAVTNNHPNVEAGSIMADIVKWENDTIKFELIFKYNLDENSESTASLVIIIDQLGVRVYEN